MNIPAVDKIRGANARLQVMLCRSRDALAGRNTFGVQDIRAICEPVGEMEPILNESKDLRTLQPELDNELKSYAGNLRELHTVLEQLRVMLIMRLAEVQDRRNHLETVGHWVAAWQQTE